MEPYGYPPARERFSQATGTPERIGYFAHYSNTSLGKIANLFSYWADVKGTAAHTNCIRLNEYFSSVVDGQVVQLPSDLSEPLAVDELSSRPGDRIWHRMCVAAERHRHRFFADTVTKHHQGHFSGIREQALRRLLSDPSARPSCGEWDMIKLAWQWCQANRRTEAEFVALAYHLGKKMMMAALFFFILAVVNDNTRPEPVDHRTEILGVSCWGATTVSLQCSESVTDAESHPTLYGGVEYRGVKIQTVLFNYKR